MDSYAQGETTPALLEETIGANLERTVASYADREALVERASGRRWTWAELDRDVDDVARGLIGAGIEKGDRVGIWGPNSAEWTLVQLATAKVGAILVNVNPSYRTHELAYVVNQSGMRMLVSATSFKTSDYRAMIQETADRLDTLERVVHLDDEHSWAGLLADGSGVSADDLRARSASLDAHDPINIQYTSGTTGFPKGATLSHHNILNNGYLVGEACRYTEEDRVCIPVPFYHCFGMVMGNLACTSHGATMVIPAPGFDPALTLRAVSDERCTSLYGVPTMFIAEWALPDFDVVRPEQRAHRDHGRLAVPRGDDEEAHRRRDRRDDDRLRHDRDVAGVDADPHRRLARAQGRRPSAGSPRTSRSRSSTRSAATRCRAARRGSSAPAATR